MRLPILTKLSFDLFFQSDFTSSARVLKIFTIQREVAQWVFDLTCQAEMLQVKVYVRPQASVRQGSSDSIPSQRLGARIIGMSPPV